MTGNTTVDLILTMFGISVPQIILGLWALLKAQAAHSAAKWDDEAVAMVEKVAQGVIEKSKVNLTGADH